MGDWDALVWQTVHDHDVMVVGGNKKKQSDFLFPLDNPSLWAI
jgi:hypothetical protein